MGRLQGPLGGSWLQEPLQGLWWLALITVSPVSFLPQISQGSGFTPLGEHATRCESALSAVFLLGALAHQQQIVWLGQLSARQACCLHLAGPSG